VNDRNASPINVDTMDYDFLKSKNKNFSAVTFKKGHWFFV